MMNHDECEHCLCRGDFEACEKAKCSKHHFWYISELKNRHAELVELVEWYFEVNGIKSWMTDRIDWYAWNTHKCNIVNRDTDMHGFISKNMIEEFFMLSLPRAETALREFVKEGE
mgnify:CR=1 FL=1